MLVRGEERRAAVKLVSDRRYNLRMPVPQKHRTRAQHEVDVLVPALVPHSAPTTLSYHKAQVDVAQVTARHVLSGLIQQLLLFFAVALWHGDRLLKGLGLCGGLR